MKKVDIIAMLKEWTRFSCGHTNLEHNKRNSDCPGWSIEDDNARGVLLEQIIFTIKKFAPKKTKKVIKKSKE